MGVRRAGVLALVLVSCGYAPLHGGSSTGEQLHVRLASSNVPDAMAVDEVLVGAREELARLGFLSSGDGYPRFEIEVLRADEASEGIAAVRDAEGRLLPASRASRVGIVARGWVVRAPRADRERDTGDVRVLETVAVAFDARSSTFRHADALRAAGRSVGRRLAYRILGLPSATADE